MPLDAEVFGPFVDAVIMRENLNEIDPFVGMCPAWLRAHNARTLQRRNRDKQQEVRWEEMEK